MFIPPPPHTHTRIRERQRQTDLPTPQKCILSGNHLCTCQFSVAVGIFFFIDTERSKICSILRHTSETTKWLSTCWIKYTESRIKDNVYLERKKKEPKSHADVVSPNCARNLSILSRYSASCSNFLRLALHTWKINLLIKPNIYVSWTQMEKETVTDNWYVTKM